MKDALVKLRQYLLSGVSYAIPFIACGGIMIAVAIAVNSRYSPNAPGNFDKAPPVLKLIMTIGVAAFTLMPVILSGYIAYAMAGKPGLVPGCVGGWLATHLGEAVVDGKTVSVSAGFLGALITGLIAGYIVMAIKNVPMSKYIRPIMPILIIPIVSSTIVGFVILQLIGHPIANAMTSLAGFLQTMQTGNQIVLALVLGAMIAFDMGGPVNKIAFFFGAGLIERGNYVVMGCVAAAICTPPLGLGLATMIYRKIWSEEERDAGIAALAMGMIGITEGAIPFAASDPLRVIPCIMFGSAVAAVIAMLGGVGDHAPHGGPIVLPVVDNRLLYVLAIVVGTIVTAVSINFVKVLARSKDKEKEEPQGFEVRPLSKASAA
jgi:fructose-specific phosphotransferase system IIC component